VKNYKQISDAIDKLFKSKSNSNLLSKKIKKMGNEILTKTENEINNFIN
jgi:hypothetical protein